MFRAQARSHTRRHHAVSVRVTTWRRLQRLALHCILTENSLIVHQVEVNHGYRCPDAQQGQDNEPGEEAAAAAAGPRGGLLSIFVG